MASKACCIGAPRPLWCKNTSGARAPDIVLADPIVALEPLGSLRVRQYHHVHHHCLASQAAHPKIAAAATAAGLEELYSAAAQALKCQAAHAVEWRQRALGPAAGCCC